MKKIDNKADNYAKAAVNWAVKNGILKGDDKGNLKLHDSISRQDLLVMLYRALK